MKILFSISRMCDRRRMTASERKGHVSLFFSLFGRSLDLVRSIFIVNSKEAISAGIKERSLREDMGMLNH
jgi:hypothetical protein